MPGVRSLSQRSQELPSNNSTTRDDPVNTQLSIKKRKTTEDNDHGTRKRFKPTSSLSDFIPSMELSSLEVIIPSRQIIPSSQSEALFNAIDEDEWAAFEADIAESERLDTMVDTVISAPPLTTEDVKRKRSEEDYIFKKEKEEEKSQEETEDAAIKMEEELEKMAILEAKVNRLRARREELRKQKESMLETSKQASLNEIKIFPHRYEDEDEDDDEEGDEDDDMWDKYTIKT